MGNIDSKIKTSPSQPIKSKKGDELIYTKMTRSQYQEFIKFLEYKNKLKKSKKESYQKPNRVENSKKTIINTKYHTKKLYQTQKKTIPNPSKSQLDNIKVVSNISTSKCPNRMSSVLQNKPKRSHFSDNYENIFQWIIATHQIQNPALGPVNLAPKFNLNHQ